MSDLIDRQAAIDAAINATDNWDGGYNITRANMIEKELNDLPSAQPEITLESAIDYLHSIGWMQEHDKILTESAQPEPKKGKWIDYSDDGYVECPFCRSATNCDDNIDELHYCFSCGAKMEGHDE